MAHTHNPSTLGGRGGWITRSKDRDRPGQHSETLSLLKIQTISWAWWCVPVIPVTQEAEARELPEPRKQMLQWAEIAPLHSSLGNKSETLSQKKKWNRRFSTSYDPNVCVTITWVFSNTFYITWVLNKAFQNKHNKIMKENLSHLRKMFKI